MTYTVHRIDIFFLIGKKYGTVKHTQALESDLGSNSVNFH